MRHLLSATLIAVTMAVPGLGGCGGRDTEPATSVEGGNEGILLDAARQPLERASEVEDLNAERKGELDQQIEASEQ